MIFGLTCLSYEQIQETCAVAGKPRDAAVNFDTQCLGTIDRSAVSVA